MQNRGNKVRRGIVGMLLILVVALSVSVVAHADGGATTQECTNILWCGTDK